MTRGDNPPRFTQGRLSAVRPSEARRSLQIPRGLKSARNDNLEKRSVAARLKAAPFQSNFPLRLKPCPPDLASLLHGRDARAYIANRGGRRRPLHTQLLPCSGAFARRRQSIW